MRDFKGLAQKLLCYRYTIPHKPLILHRFLSKLLQMASLMSHRINCTGGFGPALVNSPRNSLHLTVFVGFAALTALRLCFCALHTDEITRTDPLVQVNYVRVVDLDTAANKSDICAIRVVTISERAAGTRVLPPPPRADFVRHQRFCTISCA